jgi:lipopolysaccharide biosynthesis glycosyltransferase
MKAAHPHGAAATARPNESPHPPAAAPEAIHVVLASDRNLIRQVGITALSAIEHSSLPMRFTIVTPERDRSDPDWRTVISLLEARGATCDVVPVTFDASSFQMAGHLTQTAYYRLLLPELLAPDCHRVIYMDCDVYVGCDLAALWTLDIGDNPMGAVDDPAFSDWGRIGLEPRGGYFNSGVLLLDIQRIRKHAYFQATIDDAVANPEALTWSDNCALNRVFNGRWHRLDRRWNYLQSYFVADIRAHGLAEAKRIAGSSVHHFNSYNKPWLFETAHPLKKQYFSVVKEHPELNPATAATPGKCWIRFRRAVKWQLIALGAV